MEGGGKKTLWGREGWSERDRERDIPAELLCLPPVEKRTGFLDTCLCCLVLSSLAVCFFIWPLAVCSRSSPKPVRANYMKRPKRRGEKGAQIKAYFLRFLCDSSLTFLLLFCKEGEEKKKKDKTHQGTTWFSSFFTVFFFSFSFFFFFYIFPLTSIFHELICFVAPPRLLLYWIHLVPIHPVHNLSITGERGKLIIYWWNGAAMNF